MPQAGFLFRLIRSTYLSCSYPFGKSPTAAHQSPAIRCEPLLGNRPFGRVCSEAGLAFDAAACLSFEWLHGIVIIANVRR
ncbi:MAG TPA: hypothetical protein DEF45_06235 [Rhodopirellula sp.]|nr:hypothetical protein [Rhodopirellula sp.]